MNMGQESTFNDIKEWRKEIEHNIIEFHNFFDKYPNVLIISKEVFEIIGDELDEEIYMLKIVTENDLQGLRYDLVFDQSEEDSWCGVGNTDDLEILKLY